VDLASNANGVCDSAAIDAGDPWYVLFRCEPEHCTIRGQLSEGVTVLSEGDVIKLPPSIDSRGEPCSWVDDAPILPLPQFIISLLSPAGLT
jgi:hypothetical protein